MIINVYSIYGGHIQLVHSLCSRQDVKLKHEVCVTFILTCMSVSSAREQVQRLGFSVANLVFLRYISRIRIEFIKTNLISFRYICCAAKKRNLSCLCTSHKCFLRIHANNFDQFYAHFIIINTCHVNQYVLQ